VNGKLLAWLGLVGAQVVIGYASRATGGKPDRDVVYHWSTAAQVLVFYGVYFGIVLAISREETRELLALRQPHSWSRAASLALVVMGCVIALEIAVSSVLDPSGEQGLTPKRWEPEHAAAFAVTCIGFVLVGPFVEEATYRGLGFSLLVPYGQVLAIVATGLLFGLAHGLIEGLPILVALGVGLAWLRARTDSLYPGFVLHALFNGIALAYAVA
jgi:membrane protease YdiL (CAAX protease family)